MVRKAYFLPQNGWSFSLVARVTQDTSVNSLDAESIATAQGFGRLRVYLEKAQNTIDFKFHSFHIAILPKCTLCFIK